MEEIQHREEANHIANIDMKVLTGMVEDISREAQHNLVGALIEFIRNRSSEVFTSNILKAVARGTDLGIIIIIHRSHAHCPSSEFVLRFLHYYTELFRNLQMATYWRHIFDWYFLTHIIMITCHFSSGLSVCTCSLTW